MTASTAHSGREAWLDALLIVICQLIAYVLVFAPMGFGFNEFVGFRQGLYELNSAANGCFAPSLLLALLTLTRSRLLIVVHHLVMLLGLVGISIYFDYFQVIPHVNLLRQVGAFPDVGQQIVLQLLGAKELAIAVLLMLSAIASWRFIRRGLNTRQRQLMALAAGAVLLVLVAKGAALHTRLPITKYRYDTVYGVRRNGLLPVYVHQVFSELTHSSRDVPFPGPLNTGNRRPMELPERRLNVLLVQVESLDPWAIDAAVQGAPVMPFLRTLRERALVFASFFPQHRGGGSSDAELACLTSLLPLASHSGFMTFDASRVTTLANVLNEDGYTTVALHANVGSYFNRGPAYAGLGFDRFYDRAAFSGEAAGWSSKDSAFFRQSLELLEPLPQPWLAYLITMQSHGPFTNHDLEDTALPFTSEHSRLTRDYLLTMHEVDAALATLIEGIEGRRWLEHTIVLIFADHTSQVGPDDGPSRALGERIPMYVLAPDVPAGISHKVGSHLDLGPTILHLLGHPRPERWLGTSLLASGPGSTVVTVRGTPVVLVNGPDGRIDQVPPVRVRRHMEYSESILHP